MTDNSRKNFNSCLPKDVSGLSNEERLHDAHIFAEGCKELEECLLSLWEKGLYTFACCRGHHELEEKNYRDWPPHAIMLSLLEPYIGFETTDILKYLSAEFIKNSNIAISVDKPNEFHPQDYVIIRFCGLEGKELIKKLKEDVETGIKDSEEINTLLEEKINKMFPLNILYPSTMIWFERSNMKINCLPFEGFSSLEEWYKSQAIIFTLWCCSTKESFNEDLKEVIKMSNISEQSQIQMCNSESFKFYFKDFETPEFLKSTKI